MEKKKKNHTHIKFIICTKANLNKKGKNFHIYKKKKKKKKKKQLNGPFLWMGFNCLKARATPRRQFTFYH